ncbi:50S ribosomal protein L18 [candidate division NPL-UPA2 bacterium Unc8]|uniref:Large ribosomal subunit protein uL18 n=1 Tax=candidate division NPL-UPA2 bacterium Unc8 TaxID=1980939 RepID=A0A399FY43_UNCN2|nr:50S ribosomal protein L18 [Bacillota bacterium]MBT9138167.1 50S ribosomal protein L18 [Bacillota bacterium]MBT9146840.1 50S ribosomal protein L18 [Bacillota bacterium]RII00290.1 MAG: 50S ribosomal protein L18 [candidate division NPL-UPA2 bacterium Unc8]
MAKRVKRQKRRVWGSKNRPRLAVFRSARHIYGQLIDDENSKTLLGVSSSSASFRSHNSGSTGNIEAAKAVGALLAEAAKELGIKNIVFDRRGYLYHGRVRALAEGARKGGIEF